MPIVSERAHLWRAVGTESHTQHVRKCHGRRRPGVSQFLLVEDAGERAARPLAPYDTGCSDYGLWRPVRRLSPSRLTRLATSRGGVSTSPPIAPVVLLSVYLQLYVSVGGGAHATKIHGITLSLALMRRECMPSSH